MRPTSIPTQEKMLKVYDLSNKGVAFHWNTMGVDPRRINAWLNDSRLYPYVDPVAVSRAMAGDMAVYDSLTYYEQDIIWERLALEIDLDFTHSLAGLGTKADEALFSRFGKGSRRVFEDVKKWRDRKEQAGRRAKRRG